MPNPVALVPGSGGARADRGAVVARSRYLRFFPDRLLYLLDRLTEREFAAYCRLAMEYLHFDGELAANDRQLAEVAKLTPKAWQTLRYKLLTLGLCRIEQGRWIDADQASNLAVQRAARARSLVANRARWDRSGKPSP